MKIYLATDHAGFDLKEAVKKHLEEKHYEVEDCGAFANDPLDDYPDFIGVAGERLSKDPLSRAIIFGGSGQGEAIVANKYPNVRAIVYYGQAKEIIKLSREHNNANCLSFGARFVSPQEALQAVDEWLTMPFSGEERHARRIEKIHDIEEKLTR